MNKWPTVSHALIEHCYCTGQWEQEGEHLLLFGITVYHPYRTHQHIHEAVKALNSNLSHVGQIHIVLHDERNRELG